jgi:hypothetical protein
MKQISKKDLISLITESAHDMGEMSYNRAMPNPWDEGYNPEKHNERTSSKAKGFYLNKPPLETPDKEKGPKEVWILKVEGIDENGEPKMYKKIVLGPVSEEYVLQYAPKFFIWKKKMEDNGYQFHHLTDLSGKYNDRSVLAKNDPFEVTKSDISNTAKRLRGRIGMILPEKEAIPMSIEEKISRTVISGVRKTFDNEKVQNFLKANGVPEIKIPDQLVKHQKQGTNTYGKRQNEKIKWESNSLFKYNTVDEYAKEIDLLIAKQPTSVKSTYLTHQYQPGSKKGTLKGIGSVYVRNDLSVKGEGTESDFIWEISFNAFVGQSNDPVGLVQFVETFSTKNSGASGPGEDGTVMSNPQILSAYKQALLDIRNQIANIDLSNLVDKSYLAIGSDFDEKVAGPQPEDEPELEPQAAGAEKPKKGKKITKEAIESMIKNMLHEAINK